MDAAFLEESTCEVVALFEKDRYKVVASISDNNRVNRNMFENLCGGKVTAQYSSPLRP